MIHLATPYSHKDSNTRYYRYVQACKIAGYFFQKGYHIFSPIAHMHSICVLSNLSFGFEQYAEYDKEMLSLCSELWLVKMDGWVTSKGMKEERIIAKNMNKPYRFIEYPSLEIGNL